MACDVRFRAGLSFGQSRSERISLAIGRQIVTSLTAGTLQLRGITQLLQAKSGWLRLRTVLLGHLGSRLVVNNLPSLILCL
jgi:hypothetical protein